MLRKNILSNNNNLNNYLYTKGFEYSLDGKNYIGEYHLENGRAFTGPIQKDDSVALTKYYKDQNTYTYDKIKQFKNLVRYYNEPRPIIIRPTQVDYNSGYVTRFFFEKAFNVDKYPIEVDSQQYEQYNTRVGANGGLYIREKMRWKLTGPLYNVHDKKGMLLEMGIYEHNALEVEKISQVIPNVSYVIKNYIEFARPR